MRGASRGAFGLAGLAGLLACSSPPSGGSSPDSGSVDAGTADVPEACVGGAPDRCQGGWCWEHPALTGHDALLGIAAVAGDDVWAVGEEGLALHWDGAGWRVFDAGTPFALKAVRARARDDVWALGEGGVLHWDGCAWSRVPDPAVARGESLSAIWTAAGGDVWLGSSAAVYRGDATGFERLAGFRDGVSSIWEGERGSVWVTSGGAALTWAGGGTFTGRFMVDGPIADLWGSASDVFVASPTIEFVTVGALRRWDGADLTWVLGGSWSALWGASSGAIWAAGDSGFAHFDGSAWTSFAGPAASDLAGTGPDDVWAAGHGEVLRWDGARWSYALGPVQTRASLFDTDGTWAVGAAGTILHRDATGWRQLPSATAANLVDLSSQPGVLTRMVGRGGTVVSWAGTTWVGTIVLQGAPDLTGVTACASGDEWITGEGGAWRTVIDFSDTFAPVGLEAWLGPVVETASPFCAGRLDVWMVATFADASSQVVHWDGESWMATLPVSPGARVFGSGPDDVWATSGGRLYRRTTAGWSDAGELLATDIRVVGSGDFWALGGRDVVHLKDGVRSSEQVGGPDDTFYGIGGDETGIWVVGPRGAILRRR